MMMSLKALDIFKERLEALVPLGRGFVKKRHALVDEAELNVADHAGVFAQPSALRRARCFLIGEVHLAGLFDEVIEFFTIEPHFAEGDEGRTDVFGHFHKIFPRVGIAFAFPHDRGNVFGDVSGKPDETVTLNEGHHIVFQRQ